jgi:vacuolar protein sorting-associated protein VTA1
MAPIPWLRLAGLVLICRSYRQTADTYDAAATFFQLANIWGTTDEEAQQKIKYAKWNAARILKAIREGKDPNETNPVREEAAPQPDHALLTPEFDTMHGPSDGLSQPTVPRPVSVEEVPDSTLSTRYSSPIPQLPTVPSAGASQPSAPELPSVHHGSPLSHTGGYFEPPEPLPPSPLSQSGSATAPALPPQIPQLPSPFSPPVVPTPSNHFIPQWAPPTTVVQDPLRGPVVPPPVQNIPHHPLPPPAPVDNWQPSSQNFSNNPTHDMDIAKSQKHAKWAISALNFEDVPTAIKELRNALAALGVRT